VATDRVARFLGNAGLAPMPVLPSEQPVQSAPKKKAQERAKAAAAAAG
jgi:small subunit ribosomal protein S16